MQRFGYSDKLAAGTVASAGTLGIMIPPSTIMVISGSFTEPNLGKLFMAGILPGILGACLLCLAIVYMTWREPGSGPPGPRSSWRERGLALKDVWGVAALFLFVMGGIYGGLFTATEGAGMGAAGAMVFALGRGALTKDALRRAPRERAHQDRKSTRLNSSHTVISYAVFCLKKKSINRQRGVSRDDVPT